MKKYDCVGVGIIVYDILGIWNWMVLNGDKMIKNNNANADTIIFFHYIINLLLALDIFRS